MLERAIAVASARMAQLFEQDLAQSAEVTLASLARTSAGQRLLESALNRSARCCDVARAEHDPHPMLAPVI